MWLRQPLSLVLRARNCSETHGLKSRLQGETKLIHAGQGTPDDAGAAWQNGLLPLAADVRTRQTINGKSPFRHRIRQRFPVYRGVPLGVLAQCKLQG